MSQHACRAAREFAYNPAGASTGRTRTNRCTWSGMTSFATICHVFSAAISSNSPSSRPATRPPSSRRRRFGHHTRCRPSDVTPPADRRNRELLMHEPYETTPTLTGNPWLRTPIPLTAEAASPLGAH